MILGSKTTDKVPSIANGHLTDIVKEAADLLVFTTNTPTTTTTNNTNNNYNNNNDIISFHLMDLADWDTSAFGSHTDIVAFDKQRDIVAVSLLKEDFILEETDTLRTTGPTDALMTSAEGADEMGRKEDFVELANVPVTAVELMEDELKGPTLTLVEEDFCFFQGDGDFLFQLAADADGSEFAHSSSMTSSSESIPSSATVPLPSLDAVCSQPAVTSSPQTVSDVHQPFATIINPLETELSVCSASSEEPVTFHALFPMSTSADTQRLPKTFLEYSDDVSSSSDVSTPGVSDLTSGDKFLFPLPSDDKMAAAALTALETCSLTPLLKEELKYTIQSRRLAAGKPELVVDVSRPPVKRSTTMNREECQRNVKRQEQNRAAAQRFRQKQKDTVDMLSKKCRKLEVTNNCLCAEIQRLTLERQQLQDAFDSHLRVCLGVKTDG